MSRLVLKKGNRNGGLSKYMPCVAVSSREVASSLFQGVDQGLDLDLDTTVMTIRSKCVTSHREGADQMGWVILVLVTSPPFPALRCRSLLYEDVGALQAIARPGLFRDLCVERVVGLVGCPSLSVACPQQKCVTATTREQKAGGAAFCFRLRLSTRKLRMHIYTPRLNSDRSRENQGATQSSLPAH